MFNIKIWEIINKLQENIFWNIEDFIIDKWPDVFWALFILFIGFIISIATFKFIIYLFKRFKIIDLIDKLDIDFWDSTEEKKEWEENTKKKFSEVLWKKIQIDKVVAKASAYYVFLLFFRWSIFKLWITEVEQFLKQLIDYLPNLFIWIVVLFFWVRFADFIYDVIYHSLSISKQKTAKVIASGWKVIILFFTLMVVLTKIWIDAQIINIILTWFIAMLTIAWWLAFGLGWKDIAKEILESFKK